MSALLVILMSIGTLAAVSVMAVPAAILRGWALHLLWLWFMVPIFHLPVLGVVQAIGVGLVVTTFSPPGGGDCQKSKDYKWWTPLLSAFIGPLIGVGIGYIVKGYL